MDARPWLVILAAGDGTRLTSLSAGADGAHVPKQFCAFGTGATLLDRTLRRAAALAPPERTVAVVAAGHRRWWSEALRGLPARNVIVQPRNRGTAPGLLLPLLHVLRRDRAATVVVMPSDHHVRQEDVLHGSVREAVAACREAPDAAMLLGIQPDGPSSDYGWILPGAPASSGPAPVAGFVEKPSPAEAAGLLARGACWSSFILVGRAAALLRLAVRSVPRIVGGLGDALATGGRAMEDCYDELPAADFSRDVLQHSANRRALRLVRVPDCGWTDLGTPTRLAAWLRSQAPPAQRAGLAPAGSHAVA